MFDPRIVNALTCAHGSNTGKGMQAALTALCGLLNLPPEALNALAAGEAAVVNKGEVTCEAEAERNEFFNRLGRVTEELGLPVDATASRIIEAIDERVDNEREACASLDVRVEVPADAETWTPLEAWEEALIALNEAWRNAVRSRAASPYAPTVKGGSDA